MLQQYRLSLIEAIFVNINVMVGMGLFVNTAQLTKQGGAFSFFSYCIVGILLIPLILSIIQLLFHHPQGGFYTYASKELNPTWGFIAAWSYFIGKISSATLVLYASTLVIQTMIPFLQKTNPLLLFLLFLLTVLSVNTIGMQFGSLLQKIIVSAKFIPIFTIIATGIWYVYNFEIPSFQYHWSSFFMTIPIVLHATLGFETACILSLTIANPKKNAPRAILCSYFIVITIAALYQFFASTLLLSYISDLTTYHDAFKIIAQFFSRLSLENEIKTLLYSGIALSGVGSAFGMFYSNMWNLYLIAQHNHLPASSALTTLNKKGIPIWCIFLEGWISLIFILISQASIILLQQCSALAITFTFTISIVSLFFLNKRENKSLFLPLLGLSNCFIFIGAAIYSLIQTDSNGLLLFIFLLLLGLALLLTQNTISRKTMY